MKENLPTFRYHPEPLATGAIEASNKPCVCCEQARGYIYTVCVYSIHSLSMSLCPWCIANGQAASKFGASFSDDHPLIQAGISNDIIVEVTQKTPGFTSWQGAQWHYHCNDACEFHGDASLSDISEASQETKKEWMLRYELDEDHWNQITEEYQPAGDSSFYKFVCRHCKVVILGWDLS